MNSMLLRMEGLFVLSFSTLFYLTSGYGWLAFLLLLFAPDLAMIGYAAGNKIGARVYNAAHTYTVPLLLLLAGWFFSVEGLLVVGLIWMAHIGMDRMMGYGLKYESGFKDTHLQRL
ncbi:hypothetical protein B9G55_07970 [Saccharibacillus sp. O16]|nr:hypothetical protein B9G55_07970 [Saccharibacillus sp. O16]